MRPATSRPFIKTHRHVSTVVAVRIEWNLRRRVGILLSAMKRENKKKSTSASEPATFDTVREIARTLPGAVEGTSYGTPAFRVAKTLFARQHQDGESLVIKIEPDHRAMRMKADPKAFFITDHYLNYPWMLVRLSTVALDDLRELIEDAWRLSAPTRPIPSRDEARQGKSREPAKRPKRTRPKSGG